MLDYIVYHGYRDGQESAFGVSGKVLEYATQYAVWKALDGRPTNNGGTGGKSIDAWIAEFKGYTAGTSHEVGVAIGEILKHAAQYTGGGPEEGCSYILESGGASYQSVVVFGGPPPEGHGYIRKVSSNANISDKSNFYSREGAVYGIYSDANATQEIARLRTKADGTTDEFTLEPGTYWAREISAPPNFRLNTQIFKVEIVSNGHSEFKATDEPMTSRLRVVKKNADTDKIVPIAGFEFHVTGPGGISFDLTTGPDGTSTYANDLPFGQYTVTETKAPKPWIVNKNSTTVTLDKDGETIPAYVSNKMVKGRIKVKKTGAEYDEPIPNVRFSIVSDNDVTYPDGTIIYNAGEEVGTLVTGPDGTDTSDELWIDHSGSSTFTVTETYVPPSYTRTDGPKKVTLKYESQTVETVIQEVSFVNHLVRTDGTLNKTDVQTSKPIKNAVFDLVAVEDVRLPSGRVVYHAGEKLETGLKTDANGNISTSRQDLWLDVDGTSHYAFVEEGVPAPYLITKKTLKIEAVYVNDQTPVVHGTPIKHTNKPQPMRVHVIKVDSVMKRKIKGAKFDVIATADITVNGELKVSEGTVVDQLETDANGEDTSKELYISDDGKGHYKIVETFVPKPYSFYREEGKHTWDVTDNYTGPGPLPADKETVVHDITVENLPVYGKVKLNKDETLRNGPVEGATFNIVPVEDVKFPDGTVIEANGKKYSAGAVIETLTTDKDGNAESTVPLYVGIDKNGEAIGHYKLVETSVGIPYHFKDNEKEHTFDLVYKDMNTEILGEVPELHANNHVSYGNIKVHKNEDVTKTGVPKATFQIRAARTMTLPNGRLIYEKDQVIQTLETDDNGDAASTDDDESTRLYIDKEGTGDYYLHETSPGGPYAFPEAGIDYHFTVKYTDDHTEDVGYSPTVPVTNRVPYATNLEIEKYDAEDNSPLDGAVFELQADEDIILTNGKKLYSKDEVIDTLVTNTEGKASSAEKLYVDKDESSKYKIVETKSPAGHVIVTEPIRFTVDYQGTNVPVIKFESPFKPENKPNEIDLDKSVLGSDEVVEGATFRMWEKTDELLVTPKPGKDAYALRIDDGDETHNVRLTTPLGYAEVVLGDDSGSGYAVSLRDGKGNMTRVGTKDAPAKLTTEGSTKVSVDVIVTDSSGKSLTGITGDTHLLIGDGNLVTLAVSDGKVVARDDNAANGNANGNANEGTDAGNENDTKAEPQAKTNTETGDASTNGNDATEGDANENANGSADADANKNGSTQRPSGVGISAEYGYIEDSGMDATVQNGAYVFDELEPGKTYYVTVDGKVVYRLDTTSSNVDNGDSTTGKTEDGKENAGDSDNGNENANANANASDGENANATNGNAADENANGSTDAPATGGGSVFYGRYSTTDKDYPYKRQPILLVSDDKFIDKFTINGKDYPVATKTDSEGKIVIKRIVPGEYGFGETDIPFIGEKGKDGSDRSYLVNTNVFRFVADETTNLINGENPVPVRFTDDYTKLDVSKNEITGGPEIPGAHLTITDHDGDVVEEWTSTDTPYRIDRLTPGEYTLTEVLTPNNYDQATRVDFTVYDTGEVQKVEMHDQPISINAKIDKRQEIADPVAENTEPNGDDNNRADAMEEGGKYRYSLDYVNDSTTWVDEFTVYDPLDGVGQGLVRLDGITTAQAYQDFDGKMNVWFQTNKTPADYADDQYKANATKDDGHVNAWLVNPNDDIKSRDADGDGRILSYAGWRLWKKDVSVQTATTLSVADLGLASDEYVLGIRLEYGRVEKGFTTRPGGWDRADLKDAHDDMKPIEQIHADTFAGTSRNAVLSRLAVVRTLVGTVASGIGNAGDDQTDAGNGNEDENESSNANANTGKNANDADTKATDTNENENANANDVASENANDATDAKEESKSLANTLTAILDDTEARVREALDAQDDERLAQVVHDGRDKVIEVIKASMGDMKAKELSKLVETADAAYGSVSEAVGETAGKTAVAELDKAKAAATAGNYANTSRALGNALTSVIDGIMAGGKDPYAVLTTGNDAGNENDGASASKADGNAAKTDDAKEGATVSTDATIHYSATVLDMQVTDAYIPGTVLDNTAYVDAYRNGGGEGLEGHDNDKVTQVAKASDLAADLLAQTGDGGVAALLSVAASAAAVAVAIRRRTL